MKKQKITMMEKRNDIYYNTKHPTGYASIRELAQASGLSEKSKVLAPKTAILHHTP